MRRLFYALMEFLAEQRDYMKFTKAVGICQALGHQPAETILWQGDLVACCPRCGHDEEA